MPENFDAKMTPLRFFQLIPTYLLALSSVVVILLFVLLGQYAHPSADDFCMVSGIHNEGLWSHLWNHYFDWSGRYTGNALYGIYPLLFGMFDGLKFMPAILILGLFIAAAFFLSKLFLVSIVEKPILLVSLCFVGLYLLGMKHTASSLYWPAGGLSYQTANILFLLTAGLIIKLMDRQKQLKSYSMILFMLLIVIFLGMGTNETNMLVLTGLLLITFLINLRAGWTRVKPWVIVLLVTLICFAIVYFAPGNAVRESTFPLKHDLSRAINGSFEMGLWVLMGWLLSPLFIIASVLTPYAVSRISALSSRAFTVSIGQIFILIFITFSIPFVLQFPAWWAMGGWPPPRTVDAIYFVFILSWFFMLGVTSIYFMPQIRSFSGGRLSQLNLSIALMMVSICFVLAVFFNFKFQRALNDLTQRAEPFHEYMQKRYERINTSIDNKQLYLVVPAFNQEYPRSIYFNDIVPDSRDWRNVCYADYFGLQQIKRERQLKKTDHKWKRLRPQAN